MKIYYQKDNLEDNIWLKNMEIIYQNNVFLLKKPINNFQIEYWFIKYLLVVHSSLQCLSMLNYKKVFVNLSQILYQF